MKLMDTLHFAVGKLDSIGELVPVLKSMGARHVAYGVTPEHYPVVGKALLTTFNAALGDKFTPEVKGAWVKVYTVVADTMLAGAAEAEKEPLKAAAAK